jgi:HK97 family phage major capsid protein
MGLTVKDIQQAVTECFKEAGIAEKEEQRERKAKEAATDTTAQVIDFMQAKEKRDKRARSGELLLSLMHSRGNLERAGAYAATKWYKDDKHGLTEFEKALTAGSATDGGFLLTEAVSPDIIELLRNREVFSAFNPRRLTFEPGSGTGSIRIPKHTTGASGGWIGESQNAPATQPAFGSVQLIPKTYAGVVPISNDLIISAATDAPAFVRDDVVMDAVLASDLAYLRADGSDGQPRGLRHLASSGNVSDANSTVNVTNVVSDLGGMIQALMDANVPMTEVGWIMEPRTWKALFTALDANANPVFRSEVNQGRLFGFPFVVSKQIPRNLGSGGDETELYLVDFAEIVLGSLGGIEITVSEDAAYHDGSNVVSSFSMLQTVVRYVIRTDIITRQPDAIVVKTAVTWDSIPAS